MASDTNSLVKCAGCGAMVTVLRYRGDDGCRCERCAPARRACKNQAQGCHHSDVDSKCWSHELYFCQQRSQCVLCSAYVPRGSLSAHYATAHQDITHSAGSTWRATKVRSCLVSSVAGTAVCRYQLFKSQLFLYVCIPVSSERLSEFRCEMRVTDPDTGHARTFTPSTDYDQWFDWRIGVKKAEFPSWNTKFDVCVDVRKAESY